MAGGIDFGGLDFTGATTYYPGAPGVDGVRFEALADNATLGSPTPVDKTVVSSLLDGSFVTTESHGNREPSFQVWIKADNAIGLNYGEKLLFERCARRVEFGWTPPADWGVRTVFEAFTSGLQHQFDDMLEMRQLVRSYLLRLTCHPFGFSEDEVIDGAVLGAPVSPATTVMSDGTSATGWSSPDGAVTTSAGVLVVPSHLRDAMTTYNGMDFRNHQSSGTLSFAAVNFTTTRYISADLSMDNTFSLQAMAYVDGGLLTQVSQVRLNATTVRFTWQCADTSASFLELVGLGPSSVAAGTAAPVVVMRVDNVTRSNVGPAITTSGRESVRTVAVTGSARTAGSVAIEHATAGLGEVLFYTAKALTTGYSPALRPWLTSAVGGTDSAAVSGFQTTNSTVHIFDVDADALPAGPHLLMFRATGSNVAVTATVSTVLGATTLSSVTMPAVTVSALGIYIIGVTPLPTTKLPPQSGAIVRISFSGTFSLDELWAFHMGEDADLTWVKAGAGSPAAGTIHSRLFLDSPSIDNGGAPALYVGTNANRSDAFAPAIGNVLAWGRHLFAPPSVTMFVVTTGAANPTVTLRHRPAWFTHAGS